jgi:hypothetical protein
MLRICRIAIFPIQAEYHLRSNARYYSIHLPLRCVTYSHFLSTLRINITLLDRPRRRSPGLTSDLYTLRNFFIKMWLARLNIIHIKTLNIVITKKNFAIDSCCHLRFFRDGQLTEIFFDDDDVDQMRSAC